MSKKAEHPESLAGSLLLAHPSLKDPNFKRTAVLISAHGDEGTLGVVLNRPMGRTLGDLGLQFTATMLASVPVYCGGPVEPQQLIIVAWQATDDTGNFRLFFGIDVEKAENLHGIDGVCMRAFLGYSGWSKGQLEGELTANTWVVAPMSADVGIAGDGPDMWKQLLGALGDEWHLQANEPDEPELN